MKRRGRPEPPYTLLYVIMQRENRKEYISKTIIKNSRIGIIADTGIFH